MKKHIYKGIISLLFMIITLLLYYYNHNSLSILTAFLSGAFAHSSDKDRNLLTQDKEV